MKEEGRKKSSGDERKKNEGGKKKRPQVEGKEIIKCRKEEENHVGVKGRKIKWRKKKREKYESLKENGWEKKDIKIRKKLGIKENKEKD